MRIRLATPDDAPAMAQVRVDTWRTAYRGIVRDDILTELSYARQQAVWEEMLTKWRTKNYVYVVDDEPGTPVGYVIAGRVREANRDYDGEIFALYLDAAYQGLGWGRRLFGRAVERLLAEGMTSMMLWVLVDNHRARRFYAAAGGVECDTQIITIHGQELEEIAYCWPDLTTIVG